jgi:hypothetical protein
VLDRRTRNLLRERAGEGAVDRPRRFRGLERGVDRTLDLAAPHLGGRLRREERGPAGRVHKSGPVVRP